MSSGYVEPQMLLVVDLNSVSSNVDPIRSVQVGLDDHVRCSQVAPSVMLVPEGARKCEHVDPLALKKVLEDGTLLYNTRRDGFDFPDAIFPKPDQFQGTGILGKPQGQGRAAMGIDQITGNAKSFGVTGDVVKDQSRRVGLF